MTYTSDQVFQQALEDRFASNVDGRGYEGRISYGTKITRDNITAEVEFFNTTQGGSHYVKLSPSDEHIFYSKGWKYGIYVLYLSNNRAKLESIEKSIRKEVNSTNNHATLKSLRGKRDKDLARYNKVNLLLKSIQ